MTTRMTWKERAIVATMGTQFGAIINCAMDRKIPAPRFVGKASVTSDGFIMCGFVDKQGYGHSGAFVGSYSDLERNMSGLARHMKLTTKQTEALGKLIKSWIGTDYRS